MRVVLDWDGTVTERDTLDMLLSEFGRPLPEGSASFREVMEREMASPRLPLADAVDWLLERAQVRPGFHELAREHRPLIVSSSFEETIRPILPRPAGCPQRVSPSGSSSTTRRSTRPSRSGTRRTSSRCAGTGAGS